MTSQDFPRKRGYARLFFVAALLAWLAPFLPLSFASAAMTGWAAGVEVPADFGEEIHTGEEATARVLSVREAGPVEQGTGHGVTGTFQTWNADVRELWMEGLEAPVRVTGGHRFYSASRGWVEAHRLAVGETVRTRDGSGARRQRRAGARPGTPARGACRLQPGSRGPAPVLRQPARAAGA